MFNTDISFVIRNRVIHVSLIFIVVLIAANSHPVEETKDYIDPEGLASLTWGTHFQGIETLQFPEDLADPHLRGKRLVNEQKANQSYQSCIAPGEKKGHCKHLNTCVLKEFRTNFARFMDYFCIIERTYVGVCCPDRAEVLQLDMLNEDVLAKVLPIVATANDDNPIWVPTGREVSDLDVAGSETSVTVTKVEKKNITEDSDASRTTGEQQQRGGTRGCGMSTKSRMRIVGGRPADPQEWPWMAALLRKDANHYCGGVLITDRHVLTAAHCVYRYKAREIRVRLGEYDFRQPDETRTLDFRVAEIRQHVDFDPATYEHDIAIIKLHRPTIFNTYIWPICLPPVGMNFENKSAIVTGWGTQYFGGPASPVLMEVAVPIWPQRKCVRSFTQRIPATAMCAAAFEGGRDSCQGDSGGPLLHQLGNGRWVNVGIVSWGIRCGEPGHPGIYTRVNSYLDWIFANAEF